MSYHRRSDETPWQRTRRRLALAGHRAARWSTWALQPDQFGRPPALPAHGFDHVHVQRAVRISSPDVHPLYERGKRANLLLAAPAFDGLVLTPERPLSFWRTLGPATAERGFQHGMELQAGCIVPSIGGGLCLLSNLLFQVAVELGWHILERHGHTSEVVPGQERIWGLDATLYYPHVDLRIAPRHGTARLSVQVVGDALVVRVDGRTAHTHRVELWTHGDREWVQDGERMRESQIMRRIIGPTGLVAAGVVAHNRKRLLHDHAVADHARRSCMTCGDTGCAVRRSLPEHVLREAA